MKKNCKRLMALLMAFALFIVMTGISPGSEVNAASKPGKTKITYLKSTTPGTATVKYKKIKGAKYQIQFATNSKMTKGKKTFKTSSLKKKVTLKQGKKYYARVRTYKVSKKKKVYGKWSAVKSVTIKKSSGTPASPNVEKRDDSGVYLGNCGKSSADYVLNTSTLKFHMPSCYTVSRINSENLGYHNGKRDFLIKENYSPCGICNP